MYKNNNVQKQLGIALVGIKRERIVEMVRQVQECTKDPIILSIESISGESVRSRGDQREFHLM